MAGGRLVEEGSHDDLLAADGLYRQLWIEQQGGPPPGASRTNSSSPSRTTSRRPAGASAPATSAPAP